MGTPVDLSKTWATFCNHPICGPRQGKRLIGQNDMNFVPSHSPAMATISPPT
jgi:hypothetical protein